MQGEPRQTSKLPKFLKSLYEMCADPNFDDIIQWNQMANSFVVIDLEAFTSKVLGQYFAHSNIGSFVRQLNNYGFTKIQRGDGLLQYSHKHFIIGKWDLLYKIAKHPHERRSRSSSCDKGKGPHVNCTVCKHLPNKLAKLENTVSYLMNEVRELKMVNNALSSYICRDKM